MFEKLREKFTYTQTIVLSFALLTLIGAALLTLPISSSDGTMTPVLNTIFTSTSAISGAGLVLYDTYTHWSLFGRIVILLLIQIGNLGFIIVISMFSLFLRKRIGIYERRVLMQSEGTLRLSGVVKLLKRIFFITFITEFIGAAILAIRYCSEFGIGPGIELSFFHSVSAFCNAGFDIFGCITPGASLMEFQSDPVVLLTLGALVIVGGLGFLVWQDLAENRKFSKCSVYTRLVLVTSLGLLIFGWTVICLLEWNNPGTLGGMTVADKLLNGLFQAITLRTAGFVAIDQALLTDSGKAASMILMLVGGSSGSTAGGLKTVTFVVLLLFLAARARGRSTVCVYKRTIPQSQVLDAMTIAFLMIGLAFFGSIFISATSSVSFIDALYESVSALATVGLTAGATTHLSIPAQFLIIVYMYFGRVGMLTISLGFLAGDRAEERFRYAQTNLLIG